MPCRLTGRCQRLGETYCLHLQGLSDDAGKWGDLYRIRQREVVGVGNPSAFPYSNFSPEDGKRYVSPKSWRLLASLHDAKTQKNIVFINTLAHLVVERQNVHVLIDRIRQSSTDLLDIRSF
jgi:hypothetical protein